MTGEQLYNVTRCAARYAGIDGYEQSWMELPATVQSNWEERAHEQTLRDREIKGGRH